MGFPCPGHQPCHSFQMLHLGNSTADSPIKDAQLSHHGRTLIIPYSSLFPTSSPSKPISAHTQSFMLHLFRLQALFCVCFVMFHLSILFPPDPRSSVLRSESGTCPMERRKPHTHCVHHPPIQQRGPQTHLHISPSHFQWNVFTFMLLPLSCKTTAARCRVPSQFQPPSNRISSPRISPRAWPGMPSELYFVHFHRLRVGRVQKF